MNLRRRLTLTWLSVAALTGCAVPAEALRDAPQGKAAVPDSPGAALLGRFSGVLPCADCAGIRIALRLYAERPSGQPTRYESTETYLGTRDGDRTFERMGRWTILRGSATDSDATVYQLDYDRPGVERNFLVLGAAELRLLGRDQREITSIASHSLYRLPEDPSMDSITLAEGDADRVIEIARGRTVVIRLSSNRSTGYAWTLAAARPAGLTVLGEPSYEPASGASNAVGAGGVETWSFLASASGRQDLRFEYRRPWERDAPPARTLVYTIAVR
jgi:predicted secreted protein